MLTAIRAKDGVKVVASEESKGNMPFACPECERPVLLKKGLVKIHHFAHVPLVTCAYGLGESEEHRQCKAKLYEILRQDNRVTWCELEKRLVTVRPDIFFFLGETAVAVEVQLSSLSPDQLSFRTSEYLRKGIHVLWLPKFSEGLVSERYAPRLWEQRLHTAYSERVYYWKENSAIQPIHFSDYLLYIDHRSWFNSYGEEESAGGYHKLSTRYRTPRLGEIADLLDDFEPATQLSCKTEHYRVPPAKLMIDRQASWW